MKGAIYYVAIAKVIFSHVKITCYFHMWRYQVFARKLTWYFGGVYIIIVDYFLQLFGDLVYRPLNRGWPLNGGSTVERSLEQSHGAFCLQTDPNSLRPLKGNRDLTKLRRRRQRERQSSNKFNEQNDNSARASRFFVYFFAVPAKLQHEMTKFWVDLRTGTARR